MAFKKIKIKKRGNEFLFVGARTMAGHQVTAPSLSLIHAIAEEWQQYCELNAVLFTREM